MSVVTPSISFMNDDLSDLDAAGLLAAASGAVRARRLAEVRELEVLAAWAALHSGDRLIGGTGWSRSVVRAPRRSWSCAWVRSRWLVGPG